MKIIKVKKVTSTEDYVRRFLKKSCQTREDLAVIAEMQTGGRGTKNRQFYSPYGGLYISFIHFHTLKKSRDAFTVTMACALAVVKTLKAFKIDAQIKWPNDIFVNDKKICGMLITNSVTGDYLDYSIIGIGINVNNDLSEALKDIGVSMKQVLEKEVDVFAVATTLLYNLDFEDVSLYARYSMILGKKIQVVCPDGTTFYQVADKILDDGRLLLNDGTILSSAEVSIRPC